MAFSKPAESNRRNQTGRIKPVESNRRNQTGVSRRMRVSLVDRREVGLHVPGNARISVDRRAWKNMHKNKGIFLCISCD